MTDFLILAAWGIAGILIGASIPRLNHIGQRIAYWLRDAWRYRQAARAYRAGRRSWR